MGEESKVALRNVRREGMDLLKKLEKDHKMTEDDHRKNSTKVQELTDKLIKEIDQLGPPHVVLQVFLKYGPDGEKVIRHIERYSKPGRRVYVGKDGVGALPGSADGGGGGGGGGAVVFWRQFQDSFPSLNCHDP